MISFTGGKVFNKSFLFEVNHIEQRYILLQMTVWFYIPDGLILFDIFGKVSCVFI